MLTQHDMYCRCRICKPPLVGETSQTFDMVLTALLILAFGFMIVTAIKVLS